MPLANAFPMMFRTFRRLQIFALGSLLVGCATSPPTSLTSFHPPLQVTSLIDIESKKPSKIWVLFDERPAASIYIPSDRTTERGTHREGDTLNLYPKRSRFLEWHPPLTALIPALIIEAPILLVAKVTQSEEPSRQTPVAPASEVIALHQKYLSWMEKIASDEQYLSEHDAYFVETFKMTRRAQTERAAILADERESANLATAAFDREKFVLELGIHRILFLIPDDGTLPYLSTCASARVARSSFGANSREFESCYTTRVQMEAPNIDALKAALAIHAQRVAEMQATDLTADVQKNK